MRYGILTKLILGSLLFLPVAQATRGDDFVVYEALHRSADELVKAAAGVSSGARVSNMGAKIIVYGTKFQRDSVIKLFAELDHALNNYSVQLRLASRARSSGDSLGVGGNVTPRGANLKATAAALEGEGTSKGVQQVIVSDGGTAKLYADSGIYPRTVAVHLRSIGHSGAHVEVRETDANAVGEQAIVTELDLPLGEWHSIGAISGSNVVRSGELVARTKRSSMSAEDVQMRVTVYSAAP
jgi:hypothetical protein